MGGPTAADLCATLGRDLQPAPGFSLREGGAEVTAVHVSELPDPTAYLSGGELLLTTGLALPETAVGCELYVRRLAEVGVTALGLGLGPVFRHPPERLRAACAAVGVPLLLVPAPTPFLTVTRAYWAARVRASERVLQDTVAAHRDLVDAAVSADPLREVPRRLARLLGGWTATLTADGTVEQIHPAALADEAVALQAEVARLAFARAHSAASFIADGRYVVVLPLAVEDRVTGYLAVGTDAQLGPDQRRVATTAAALLGIDALRARRDAVETATVRRCVATLVDHGLLDAAHRLADVEGVGPLPREVRLLGVRVTAPADLAVAAGLVDDAAPHAWPLPEPDAAWFLVPVSGDPGGDPGGGLDLVLQRLADGPASAVVLTAPARLEQVGAARTRAAERLRTLAADAVDVERSPLPDHAVEARLDAWVAGAGADVVAALGAYLRHRGQWEAASRASGLHRNTLRYRVARAREALGLDLDDPDVAARVWLSLRRRDLA
ncbi:PucR family transcriptional regulator [Nocardioides zeae]|uniref:PucR family transcriptional regulator n=1 Tax=Nocardioides imazamoxiresistens TaxID=3231893 RepID=A0ABU3PWS2_9ACTN|nr:PucR family transcriptional regulator [Nocardioides zeae]MDT9593688.1 PucR family transcriptional regulator [Nocardioides zeae]